MTADFKMKFDDGGTPDGLKKTADAAEKTAAELLGVGEAGVKASDGILQTADGAKDASKALGDQAEAIEKTAKAADSLADEVSQGSKKSEEFSFSLDNVAKKSKAAAVAEHEREQAHKAAAAASKHAREQTEGVKEGIEGIEKAANAVGLGEQAGFIFFLKEGVEGLIKLGKAASTLTLSGAIAGIKGMTAAVGAAVGAIAGLAATVGILVAGLGSLIYVIYRLIVPTKELADENNFLDKAMANTVFTGEKQHAQLLKLKQIYEEDDEKLRQYVASTERATQAQMEMSREAMSLEKQVEELGKTLGKAKESYQLKIEVENMTSIDEIDKRIAESQANLEAIKNRDVATPAELEQRNKDLAEGLKKSSEEQNALIARRNQLLDEQRNKERELAEQKKKQAEEEKQKLDADFKRIEERQQEQAETDADAHKKRLEQIEAEKKAREDAHAKHVSDEAAAAKQQEEAAKKWLEQNKQKQKGQQDLNQTQQQPAQMPSQPSAPTEKKNPYGEGEAPTAGQDNSAAYAAALDPFSQFTTDFNIGGNSYVEGDGKSPGAGTDQFQELVDKIDKKLTDANIARTAKETEMEKLRQKNDAERKRKLEEKFGTSDKRYVQGGDEQKKQFQEYDNYLRKGDKEEERNASRDFDKNGPTDAQKEDAVKKISDKTTELFQKQTGADEAKQELEETTTQGMVQMAARISAMESFLKKQNEMRARALGLGRGTAPSNRASQARANP